MVSHDYDVACGARSRVQQYGDEEEVRQLFSFLVRVAVIYADSSRTHRFAILAMSLSSLFDITQPTDFLRSALNMLTEYEQAKEDSDRPKMVTPTLHIIFC